MDSLGTTQHGADQQQAVGAAASDPTSQTRLVEAERRAVQLERQRDEAEARIAALEEKLSTVSKVAREHQDAIEGMHQARLSAEGDNLPLHIKSDGSRAANEQLLAAESKALLLAQELEIAAVRGERDASQLEAESEDVRKQGRRAQKEEEAFKLCAEQAEGLCFERDWHITELRAAAGVNTAKTGKDFAEAEKRSRLGQATEEEAKAMDSGANKTQCKETCDDEVALRKCLTKEFEKEHTPVRQQVLQGESEVQSASRRQPDARQQHGQDHHTEDSAANTSKALLLAQELEIAAAKGEKHNANVLQLRAEAEAMRHQMRKRANGDSPATVAGGSQKEDEAMRLCSLSEGGQSAVLEEYTKLEGLCFDRDWRVTELQAAAVEAATTGGLDPDNGQLSEAAKLRACLVAAEAGIVGSSGATTPAAGTAMTA